MHYISALIVRRLAAHGVAKPTPQLVAATEARLAPHVTALVTRRLTKPLIARCFAATLIEAQGSPEGMVEDDPARASSEGVGHQAIPHHVAGTTAPGPVEAP